MKASILATALLVVVAATFAGCSAIEITRPAPLGDVVTLPASAKVQVKGSPRVASVRIVVNGAGSIGPLAGGSNLFELDLALPAGRHRLDIRAEVPCWYCTGGTFDESVQRKVCVVAPGPLSGPSKTPLSNAAGGSTWKTNATAFVAEVVVATDTGTPSTRWAFQGRGIGTTTGQIASVEFPCRCLRSMEDRQGAQVALVMCDDSDALQLWQSVSESAYPPGNFSLQNTGRGYASACLSEGPPPDKWLVHRDCNSTADQVWSIRDNTTGQTGGSPW